MQLQAATWPEIAALKSAHLLAIPVGSLEQHGPHLPFNTDTVIATELTTRLAAWRPDVVAAPALPFGASGEHADFPGTLLINHEILALVLIELIRSARASFAGVILVSAHGGNEAALAMVNKQSVVDGDNVVAWSVRCAGGDAHAGITETSMMLAIDPGAVRTELAEAGNVAALASIADRLRNEGVRPVSSNGVLGDPTGASEAHGRELLSILTADLVQAVADRWPVADGPS
jgi:mycofactocin precursor peptide peptidase